jgi:hypothetical protein
MRPASWLRTALGTTYLLVPQWVPSMLGVQVDRRARVVVRILGARNVIQSVVISLAPARAYAPAIGAAVDALHAASMVALAAVDERRRRLALADAGVAAAFGAAGLRRAHVLSESGAKAA